MTHTRTSVPFAVADYNEAVYNRISKAYYDRKRAEGKHHNAAVISLARRRCNVIFAMLGDGTYYQPPITPAPEPAAIAA